MTSPTQLSLAELRKRGYMAAVVEKFNSFIKIRQDLWGFGDILAVHPIKKDFLIIQATPDTGGQFSKHKMKCEEKRDKIDIWKQAGGRFEIWAWAKKGKAKTRKLWTVRTAEL